MDNLSDWNLAYGRTLGCVGGPWEDKQDPIVAHPMSLKVAVVLVAPGDRECRWGLQRQEGISMDLGQGTG